MQPGFGARGVHCGLQGCERQLRVDVPRDGIAHDLAAARIKGRCQEAEPGRHADVGDVGNPDRRTRLTTVAEEGASPGCDRAIARDHVLA